jgi:glucose/arabinose dehydrogenase
MHRGLALLLVSALAIPESGASAVPLTTVRVAANLAFPVYVTSPPGDPRLFIVEQAGRIKILENGSVLSRPFLDIASQVNSVGQEQGLLGLAFDPAYAASRFFFVYFCADSGAGKTVVRRFRVTSDPDSADASSSHPILEIAQPASNHNGGHIDFGPDGFLYVGLGDGGGGGGPAQDGSSLLGKLLRIDVSSDDFPADPARNYSIPAGNPFVNDPDVRDEIWAMGMRNPYRWSFDRATDDLVIADVGHHAWEELDFQPASSEGGENYGWPLMEGFHCFDPPKNCDNGTLTHPVHEYAHDPPGPCWSITGGYVYRGNVMPALRGTYFFGDFCLAKIWSCRVFQGGIADLADRTLELDPPNTNINNVAGFGEDAQGEIYIVERGTISGEVFKIVPHPSAVHAPLIVRPLSFEFGRGRPNPSRGSAIFDLNLPRPSPVSIFIFDAQGRLLQRRKERRAAGPWTFEWNGKDARGDPLPAGVYFLRADVFGERITQRHVLMH